MCRWLSLVLGLILFPAPARAAPHVFLSREEGAARVLPGAARVAGFRRHLDRAETAAIETALGQSLAEGGFYTFIGLDADDRPTGLAAIVSEVGKVEPITFIVGADLQGRVTGVEVLVYREEIGGEVRHARFLRQYLGKDLEDPIQVGRDIVHITGATLSCHAASRAVRRVLVFFRTCLLSQTPESLARLALSAAPVPAGVRASGVPLVRTRIIMGMACTLTIYDFKAGDPEATDLAADAAFAELERLDAVLSTWREDSELARLDAAIDAGPVPLSEELRAFIADNVLMAEATEGAFDCTVGPLLSLWKAADGSAAEPSPESLEAARVLVDSNRLEFKDKSLSAPRGMRIDSGGLGAGWAVDRAAEVLRKQGVDAALVNLGGDIFALGAPPDRDGWEVAVRDAIRPDQFLGRLLLKDMAVATSGNYERTWTIGGRRYAQVIDPRTGRPAERAAGSAAIAKDAATADGLSTALLVLDLETALGVIETLGAEGLIQLAPPANGSSGAHPTAPAPVMSRGWAGFLKKD